MSAGFLGEIFFGNPAFLGRVLIVDILAYVALVIIVLLSGKGTFSSMNPFDFIVNVAIGSILASTIVSRDVSLAEGVLTLGLLIVLQYIISWSSVRSEKVQKAVKSEPRLIFHDGEFLYDAMRRERSVASEVRQALRSEGIGSPGSV
ncbi:MULTISPECIES: YetF domain-containing protein [unclassified Methanoculleus]|uniref:DUF421 domain-containing protein n=1 Tax=unclassified Methanoculleus TaxID=2619537 RepID=UPI0025CF40FB|nr:MULTISPECIES: YetF domain-containing protein [unclassified Methanoculleus]MCK9316917.1 DUF421 domain-containing protein [Methanoculleus sp.]MDD2253302.1 DUF421 domain-containing protein [Methanoculleus sp.]MDD2788039.1 DUF421 domain-containing protein [Methanoculleus sp.]MDD3215120.1 DUF421 domain-containing protein [Methanoculleus sp.]MDD4313134.1 DUF421 domain-containing protein [Methanoculleus sp.]